MQSYNSALFLNLNTRPLGCTLQTIARNWLPLLASAMNSTNLTADHLHANVEMPTLSYLLENFTLYRPELELLWVLLTFAPFLPTTMRYTSGKFTRARRYPYIPLFIHIVTGPMLVLRYHARYVATRAWPKPELSDLALFAAFNLTSFLLEAARSGQSYYTPAGRSGFQAAILIQTLVIGASWLRGRDPALFRASVKLFNWFASFRAFSRWAGRINPSLEKDYDLKWSTTIVLSGTFAMWEAGVPAGVPGFLGLVAVLMVVERAVAEMIHR